MENLGIHVKTEWVLCSALEGPARIQQIDYNAKVVICNGTFVDENHSVRGKGNERIFKPIKLKCFQNNPNASSIYDIINVIIIFRVLPANPAALNC